MQKFICLCTAFTALAVGGNLGLVQQAQARWKSKYVNIPYREWHQQQRDKIGLSCCELSDASPVYNAYIKQGHVPIRGNLRSTQN
jgi:hypothetical protein